MAATFLFAVLGFSIGNMAIQASLWFSTSPVLSLSMILYIYIGSTLAGSLLGFLVASLAIAIFYPKSD